jgi:hypothetical protein
MSTAVAIEIPIFECPDTLIPTKADLCNMFRPMASLPSQLERIAVSMAITEAEKLQDEADQIRKYLQTIKLIFSQYDPESKDCICEEDEWECICTRVVSEYHTYIQTKMMSIIAKVIPVEFNVKVIGGVEIDVLAVMTDPNYRKEMRDQISGARLMENLEGAAVEEFEEALDKRRKILDPIFELIPKTDQTWNGEYGVESLEKKAQAIWDYIMREIKAFCNNTIFYLFNKLMSVFDEIWDLLGLPDLPIPLSLDPGELIDFIVEEWKAEMKRRGEVVYNELIEKLEALQLFGFSILDIIGGEIVGTVEMAEQKIARLKEAAADFKENWQMFLLKKWMETVTKFFKAIGLGALVELITFTFCDFLSLLGFKGLDISGFDNVSEKPSTSSSPVTNNKISPITVDTSGIFQYVATAGQTVFTGVDTNGNSLSFSNIEVFKNTDKLSGLPLIGDYSKSGGNTVTLDDATEEGDDILIILT